MTTAQHDDAPSVAACLAELLDQLGIATAHFAGRGSADLKGFLAQHPERVASLTVLCPAVLEPLDLSPGQWEPLIPVLAARYCTITLGGALLGSVASLEERGRSGYMGIVRELLDAMAIAPGESVLERRPTAILA